MMRDYITYLLALLLWARPTVSQIRNYTNPILPGWHSDPSCIFVEELDDIFLCTTSTFLTFPGIPIYSSHDLINWKLASHAFNRPAQIPGVANSSYQSDGIYASTIRFHNGTLYLITAFLSGYSMPQILAFKTTNPHDSSCWSDPLHIPVAYYGYDPDLFWDVDGQLYLTYAAYNASDNTVIMQTKLDMDSMETGNWTTIWTGTGALSPEGPHVYLKDHWYYLLIAEGGTGLNHSVTIARARSPFGPYSSYIGNPILTNNDTVSYFQTVGHADLFQDKGGNWWGVALSTRSGPAWKVYPMGRETVLYPVKWDKDDWPILMPVSGSMAGPLQPSIGSASYVNESEWLRFEPGSQLPKHFLTWRPQPELLFTVSPTNHSNTMRILPSRANLTGDSTSAISNNTLAFIGRLQTSTLFSYSVEIEFTPTHENGEAGITIFLDQYQHIDLGIVLLHDGKNNLAPHFRFSVEASGVSGVEVPDTFVTAVPSEWLYQPITLKISAQDDFGYVLSAAPVLNPGLEIELGRASAQIVSGGDGKFTGAILGAYATANGGNETVPSYISNWIYVSIAQEIASGMYVYTV